MLDQWFFHWKLNFSSLRWLLLTHTFVKTFFLPIFVTWKNLEINYPKNAVKCFNVNLMSTTNVIWHPFHKRCSKVPYRTTLDGRSLFNKTHYCKIYNKKILSKWNFTLSQRTSKLIVFRISSWIDDIVSKLPSVVNSSLKNCCGGTSISSIKPLLHLGHFNSYRNKTTQSYKCIIF